MIMLSSSSSKDNLPIRRLRRNRWTPAIRNLVQETHLLPSQLIAPVFVIEGHHHQTSISSMPGVFRYTIDLLIKEVTLLYQLGVQTINLFCVVASELKDAKGSEAVRSGNLLQRAVSAIKQAIPEVCIMVDIALDPYTDHGHDGLVNERYEIDNDSTLPVLAQMSVLAAEAGADIVAPSDMMDGRVAYIRAALDQAGFTHVGILAYAAKYASAFYGPFRETLNSAPKFGNKKTYQLNPANYREALLECQLDEWEGADLLLIKPALTCLDIIAKAKLNTNLPVGAYQVSGEYAMIMAASQNGWINANDAFMESLLAIKRAGADFILTYAARQYAEQWRALYL